MRLALLFVEPYLSTDIYRYIWDGRVQAAGINPYRYVPKAPELAQLRDAAIFPLINRASYAPTIYPPVAQAIFLAITRLGESVLVMKLGLLACEAATVAALLALLRAARRAADAHRRLRLASASRLGDRRQRPRGRSHDRAADGGPAAVRAGPYHPGRRGGDAGGARQARGVAGAAGVLAAVGLAAAARRRGHHRAGLSALPFRRRRRARASCRPTCRRRASPRAPAAASSCCGWRSRSPVRCRTASMLYIGFAALVMIGPRAGGGLPLRPLGRGLDSLARLAADCVPGALVAALSLVLPGAGAVPGTRTLRHRLGAHAGRRAVLRRARATTCCPATTRASPSSPWRRWPPSPTTCGAGGARAIATPAGETA